MIVQANDEFCKNTRKYSLNILTAGYGELDSTWHGDVVNTPYSRLFFMLGGEFYIITRAGERIDFKEGRAYLIPSGSSYYFGCDGEMRHLFFHLQLCSFDNIDILGRLVGVVSVPMRCDDRLAELTLSRSCDDSFKMEHVIRSVLASMIEKNGVELSDGEYSAEVRGAIQYITENLSVKLSTAEIAREVHVATSTLTRKFRQQTGMSVGEYIDKQIMTKAERALIASDASVLEISERFGFCDQFYFSRRFKEVYGETPSKHRKKINI